MVADDAGTRWRIVLLVRRRLKPTYESYHRSAEHSRRLGNMVVEYAIPATYTYARIYSKAEKHSEMSCHRSRRLLRPDGLHTGLPDGHHTLMLIQAVASMQEANNTCQNGQNEM